MVLLISFTFLKGILVVNHCGGGGLGVGFFLMGGGGQYYKSSLFQIEFHEHIISMKRFVALAANLKWYYLL